MHLIFTQLCKVASTIARPYLQPTPPIYISSFTRLGTHSAQRSQPKATMMMLISPHFPGVPEPHIIIKYSFPGSLCILFAFAAHQMSWDWEMGQRNICELSYCGGNHQDGIWYLRKIGWMMWCRVGLRFLFRTLAPIIYY